MFLNIQKKKKKEEKFLASPSDYKNVDHKMKT